MRVARRITGPFAGNVRVSPFLYDLALTVVTSLATIGGLLLFAQVLAERLGPEGFGAVMLARRLVATLDPLSTFAMVIAVTRFAALATPEDRGRVLVSGTSISMTAGLCCGLLTIVGASPIASIAFGDVAYVPLVVATGLVITAYSAFITLYAWYRGTDRMMLANGWQLWAIAAGPVAVAVVVARPGEEWRVLAGLAALLATALLPLAWEVAQGVRTQRPFDRSMLRAMMAYAAPRVPGGLAFGALLAVAPLMAPHLASLVAVGYVAAGQALLRVVEGATEAFGRVALAKVSQLFSAGEHTLLGDRIADLNAVVLHVGAFATCQLWLWVPQLIAAWLGAEFLPGSWVVRIIVLAVLPYLAFATLRSVLDAVEERAVNARNLYVAIGVTTVGSLILGRMFEAEGLAVATTLGLTLLGLLTFRAVRQRYAFDLDVLMAPQVLLLNIGLFGVAVAARRGLQELALPPVAAALLIEGALAAVYGIVLWRLGARWMRKSREGFK